MNNNNNIKLNILELYDWQHSVPTFYSLSWAQSHLRNDDIPYHMEQHGHGQSTLKVILKSRCAY